MDIDALAKKIRAAVMDSAEDQGRTFNASILDDVIAKELRLHMPAPSAPSAYPWAVVPLNTDCTPVNFYPAVQISRVECGPGGRNELPTWAPPVVNGVAMRSNGNTVSEIKVEAGKVRWAEDSTRRARNTDDEWR